MDYKSKQSKRSKSPPAKLVAPPGLVTIRAGRAFQEWLKKLSDDLGAPVSKVVDDALVRHACAEGFDQPPPPRLRGASRSQ